MPGNATSSAPSGTAALLLLAAALAGLRSPVWSSKMVSSSSFGFTCLHSLQLQHTVSVTNIGMGTAYSFGHSHRHEHSWQRLDAV